MKKIFCFFTVLFTSLFMVGSVKADSMTCQYNVVFGYEMKKGSWSELDYNSPIYFKYKFTYNDDGTLVRETVTSGNNSYSEISNKAAFNVQLYDKNGNAYSSIGMLGDNLTANSIKTYYDKKSCPYIRYYNYDGMSPLIEPVEDTSLHDVTSNSIVTKGEGTISSESGNQTNVKEPEVTKECTVHTNTDDIDNIDGVTVRLRMYDNGKKSVAMYFNDNGSSTAQEHFLSGTSLAIRLSNKYGRILTFQIDESEFGSLFHQGNMAMINNNYFDCPSNVYIYETSYTEGYYELTTNVENTSVWNQTTGTESGAGDDKDNTEYEKPELVVEDVDICTNNNTLKTFQVIGKIIFIIKILVPIILIVMGSIDFAKASLSGDDKAISQAAVTLGKRILTGLIIFFIPTVLDFFLSLVGGVSDTMGKYNACTSCVLSPYNENECNPQVINSEN